MESAADSPLRGLLTRARSQASIAHTFPARLDRVLFGLLYNKVSGAGVPRVIMARAVRARPRLTIIPGACDSRIQCAVDAHSKGENSNAELKLEHCPWRACH